MLPGYNHNIRYKDKLFHVQTEDNGLSAPDLVTQVFLGGQIVALERLSYGEILTEGLDDKARDTRIKALMQDQHKRLLRNLVAGQYDAKIADVAPSGSENENPTVEMFQKEAFAPTEEEALAVGGGEPTGVEGSSAPERPVHPGLAGSASDETTSRAYPTARERPAGSPSRAGAEPPRLSTARDERGSQQKSSDTLVDYETPAELRGPFEEIPVSEEAAAPRGVSTKREGGASSRPGAKPHAVAGDKPNRAPSEVASTRAPQSRAPSEVASTRAPQNRAPSEVASTRAPQSKARLGEPPRRETTARQPSRSRPLNAAESAFVPLKSHEPGQPLEELERKISGRSPSEAAPRSGAQRPATPRSGIARGADAPSETQPEPSRSEASKRPSIVVVERSLDEVILGYLEDDRSEE